MAGLYENAIQLAKSGNLEGAWQQLVLNPTPLNIRELHLMLDLALLLKAPDKQEHVLSQLLTRQASNYKWSHQLSNLYFNQQKFDSAVDVLKRYVALESGNSSAWFNLAYMAKFTGEHLFAISAYEQALAHHIDSPEEVHCNLGNIYSQELLNGNKAKAHYQKALALKPNYSLAKFNLAGLLEKEGKLEEAALEFLACASDDDFRLKCLTRALDLSHEQQDGISIANDIQAQLLNTHDKGAQAPMLEIDKVDAYFSLGRFYESLAYYEQSWQCYENANKLDRANRASTDVTQSLQLCTAIQAHFKEQSILPTNNAELVFICGLHRSGSTLLETMLSTHPLLSSGGEVDVFRKQLFAPTKSFQVPSLFTDASAEAIIKQYLARVANQTNMPVELDANELSLSKIRLLDKQPENFLLIGYIKQLFPKAKFIWTRRNKLNNIFSIYTQHFGYYQAYSSSLDEISAFYDQHLDLLHFWQGLYCDDIKVVDYEDLVTNTANVITDIQSFLNVEHNNDYQKFYQTRQLVSTASMAQVRKPLHEKSLNRAEPYQKWLNN